MNKAINQKHLPIKDLIVSGLIVFIMSTLIGNIYNSLLGFTYALGNIITLSFLSWLYKESWIDSTKLFNDKKSHNLLSVKKGTTSLLNKC